MHTTYCEEEGEKSGNIPNCRRNLFSHPGNLARTEKCLKGFMISAHCTSHGVQANQAHRPSQPSAQNEQTTDPCGIPEVRPRLQTSGPTSPKCFMCHHLPPITCHTNVSSTKDIKRVNKNIRRLLAVTGPCSWMGHNFSQFPR